MITFENINTGEKKSFTGSDDPQARQAHMAAYLNSSNMSPNALGGQDFGWRLAPEHKAEIDRIKTNYEVLEPLARRLGISIEDIRDYHILDHLADKDFAKDALEARGAEESSKHKENYEERLKQAKIGAVKPTNKEKK